MTTEDKFYAIRARYIRAIAAREAFRDKLLRKYGTTRPADGWMTKAEVERIHAYDRAESKEMDKMFDLLDTISTRRWRTGIAAWWVIERLSYADAITDGPLSVVPQPGFGSSIRDAEKFAA